MGQVQIPSSAFFELCFCLYLSGTEKTQKQTIKEGQNKKQNEDEIHQSEAQSVWLSSPWQSNVILSKYISGMLVRSGLRENSFFMLQMTALRDRGGEMRENDLSGRFISVFHQERAPDI